VLYVTTDAPLPRAASDLLAASTPPPLFDRLRVEIFPPGEADACANCTREFAADARTFDDGRASIGVVPTPGVSGYRARVRLFRSAAGPGEEPRTASTIEAVVALPTTEDEGIIEATVHLATDDVGAPTGTLDEPIAPSAGPATLGLVGTWEGAIRKSCTTAPRDDETCIPGGAYWMDDPHFDDFADPTVEAGRAERLVVLSPFFIDLSEVTVAAFRASGQFRPNGSTTGPDPILHDSGQFDACLYTLDPGPYEALPINCILWSTSTKHCNARGKRLPTEAEWEYVAGALTSKRWVWGYDIPTCNDAVYGRESLGECEGQPFRASPAGAGARDRITIGGREIVDLVGNVTEWTADWFNRDDEPCWSARKIYRDPTCATSSVSLTNKHAARGASFNQISAFGRAASRGYLQADFERAGDVGIRCARSDQ
jgi:formylglycine-generating enzyme required for sulfatase activity